VKVTAVVLRTSAMPHGLDHIVHAVRDLDAAAGFLWAGPALSSGHATAIRGATHTTVSCN